MVSGFKSERDIETGSRLVPFPADWNAVVLPRLVVSLYSNQKEVGESFGLTTPLILGVYASKFLLRLA